MLELKVLCHARSVLDRARWQHALREAEFALSLAGEVPSIPGSRRFVRCTFEGLESGFDCAIEGFDVREWSMAPADAGRVARFDTVVLLVTYPNAQEIAGSVTGAAAYASATGGVVLDAHFEQRVVESIDALAWARRWLPEIRSQFDGPSRVRAASRAGGT